MQGLQHLLNNAKAWGTCTFWAAKQSRRTIVPSALARPLKAVFACTPGQHTTGVAFSYKYISNRYLPSSAEHFLRAVHCSQQVLQGQAALS